MATWADLDAELALWRGAGERPTFWWRDDDTQAPTQALTQLIALTKKHGAPLHLAVIPLGLDPALAPYLTKSPHVWSMQHGLTHKNHEPKPARASEIGQERALEASHVDLARGWALMAEASLPNRLAVLVPPWNRIGAKLIPHLHGWGYGALSGFGPREPGQDSGPLVHINAHVEPLRWRPDAVFAGEGKTLAQCVEHLRARRIGAEDRNTATGIVTHHLQTPPEVWAFCDALAERLNHKNAVEWIAMDRFARPV
ncbi:MAG: hypothetical protein AAF307_13230 [Pseudomonadota bacterium]